MTYRYLLMLFVIIIYEFTSIASDTNQKLHKHHGCEKLLHELGNTQGLLLYCFTVNAVPVNICTTCHEQYVNVTTIYDTLYKNCSEIYFDHDRVNLIPSTQSLLVDLWNKPLCDDCLKDVKKVDNFHEKENKLEDCIATQNNDTIKICKICFKDYQDLNNFYLEWDKAENSKICFDIQDTMNRTRLLWSNTYKCCKREVQLLYFSITSGFILLLPIIFYISTFAIGKKMEREHGVLSEINETERVVPYRVAVEPPPSMKELRDTKEILKGYDTDDSID